MQASHHCRAEMTGGLSAAVRQWREIGLSGIRRASKSTLSEVAVMNGVLALLTVAAGLVLARGLTESQRGIAALAILWPTLGHVVFALGIRGATVYFVASKSLNRKEIVANAMGGALASSVSLCIVGTLVLYLGKVPSGYRVPILIVLLATPVSFVGGVSNGVAQGVDLRLWNRLRIAYPASYAVGLIILLVSGRLTAISASAAYVIAIGIQTAFAFHYAVAREGLVGVAFDRKVLSTLYRYGTWTTFSATLDRINTRLDLLVLGLLVGAGDVGRYAVAVGMAQVITPLSSVTAPWVLPRIAGSTPDEMRRSATAAIGITAGISASLAVGGLILAPTLVRLLVGERWLIVVPVFRILLVGSVFLALRDVLIAILNGCGRPRLSAISDGLAAAVTAIALIPAIRWWGITGAAGVSTVAYGLSVAALFQFVRREVSPRVRKRVTTAEASAQTVE